MAEQNLSYLTFELAGLFGALLVIYSLGGIRTLISRRFMTLLASLSALWISWDYLAVYLDVFRFPREGNLPLRILGLPLEEHLFFFVHVITIWTIVLIAESTKPTTT